MKKDLHEKILSFNKQRKISDGKALDLDTLINAIRQLPPGQLKKLVEICPELEPVLNKYNGGESDD